MEFGLHTIPRFEGETCLSLRQEYEKEGKAVRHRHRKDRFRRRVRINSALSSLKRLFDRACACDKYYGGLAREEWKERMAAPGLPVEGSWCHDPLWLLKSHVRELCSGWGSRLETARKGGLGEKREDGYVPDQQGCYELRSIEGGTLGVSESEYSLSNRAVRVGVAKTKGKSRVVTMQSARVKRVLSPVHNALYDYLSDFGWLVRGDVTKEDFEAVLGDVRPGERHISGDYESATDNIKSQAVTAIVEVLGEDPHLTEEEREVLVGSFDNVYWRDPCTGECGPINKGSMMGNLVSFPLLCLLNKACYDICTDISFGTGTRRIGRFNGDDCMFNGDLQFYQLWRTVTLTYGLLVNEQKTSFVKHYLELNSNTFECSSGRIVDKPVLSFLRRKEDVPDDLLSDIFRGIGRLSKATIWWVISVPMRYEVSIRPISLSNIPKVWRKDLLKRRWFRDALHRDPPPVKEKGQERKVETVLGPPPKERWYPLITGMVNDSSEDHVKKWRGTKVLQHSVRIDRLGLKSLFRRLPPAYVRPLGTQWSFLWPKSVWDFFYPYRDRILLTPRETHKKWLTDHPLLHPVEKIFVRPLKKDVRTQFARFGPQLPEHAILERGHQGTWYRL